MEDFFEIDFLSVESTKSGDAIPIRYKINGDELIHVVDGGFQKTGQFVVDHINKFYDQPKRIDHVVATHPDGDHAGGLRTVLEKFEVGALWMNRPWVYSSEIIGRFTRFANADSLAKRLKEIYPNIAALEDLAIAKGIPIYGALQGIQIGAFTVMAPTKERLLDLIVDSEKTPESVAKQEDTGIFSQIGEALVKLKSALWGDENFSPNETSAENDMSIVQYANLCDKRVLLTGDAGRTALMEAAEFAPNIGLKLPGIDRIQIPHHGSRRNVSSEVLDTWLGEKYFFKPAPEDCKITSIVSASQEDTHHPRKAVVRGFFHRGAKVLTTEGGGIRTGHNAPIRDDWGAATPIPYPEDQEE